MYEKSLSELEEYSSSASLPEVLPESMIWSVEESCHLKLADDICKRIGVMQTWEEPLVSVKERESLWITGRGLRVMVSVTVLLLGIVLIAAQPEAGLGASR